MTSKQALYRLIDELPEAALPEVERYLESVLDDPVLRAILAAPIDDEPETDAEREAVREARAEAARGELIDDADLTL
jgi:hypothetical protein